MLPSRYQFPVYPNALGLLIRSHETALRILAWYTPEHDEYILHDIDSGNSEVYYDYQDMVSRVSDLGTLITTELRTLN